MASYPTSNKFPFTLYNSDSVSDLSDTYWLVTSPLTNFGEINLACDVTCYQFHSSKVFDSQFNYVFNHFGHVSGNLYYLFYTSSSDTYDANAYPRLTSAINPSASIMTCWNSSTNSNDFRVNTNNSDDGYWHGILHFGSLNSANASLVSAIKSFCTLISEPPTPPPSTKLTFDLSDYPGWQALTPGQTYAITLVAHDNDGVYADSDPSVAVSVLRPLDYVYDFSNPPVLILKDAPYSRSAPDAPAIKIT